MFNLVVFLLTTANAGKLADDNGFRGKSFGPASVLSEAPMEGCLEGAEEDSAWRCETTIGEHPVTVNYIVDEDLFGAVILNASGYTACEGVKSVLTQARCTGSAEPVHRAVLLDGRASGGLMGLQQGHERLQHRHREHVGVCRAEEGQGIQGRYGGRGPVGGSGSATAVYSA